MKAFLFRAALVASIFLMPVLASAQNYSIDWFTIDGGGGTSTGGVFSVSGTIGQPDAGVLTGGNYTLVGGFWSIVSAVQTPGAPTLHITRDPVSGDVTVFWASPATGFDLQENANVANPAGWVNVSATPAVVGTNKTVTVSSPVGNRYYRLRNPASP